MTERNFFDGVVTVVTWVKALLLIGLFLSIVYFVLYTQLHSPQIVWVPVTYPPLL